MSTTKTFRVNMVAIGDNLDHPLMTCKTEDAQVWLFRTFREAQEKARQLNLMKEHGFNDGIRAKAVKATMTLQWP